MSIVINVFIIAINLLIMCIVYENMRCFLFKLGKIKEKIIMTLGLGIYKDKFFEILNSWNIPNFLFKSFETNRNIRFISNIPYSL